GLPPVSCDLISCLFKLFFFTLSLSLNYHSSISTRVFLRLFLPLLFYFNFIVWRSNFILVHGSFNLGFQLLQPLQIQGCTLVAEFRIGIVKSASGLYIVGLWACTWCLQVLGWVVYLFVGFGIVVWVFICGQIFEFLFACDMAPKIPVGTKWPYFN
ncbi:hypothetical protein GIB67_022903, partial [Kingdonia uniflora]